MHPMYPKSFYLANGVFSVKWFARQLPSPLLIGEVLSIAFHVRLASGMRGVRLSQHFVQLCQVGKMQVKIKGSVAQAVFYSGIFCDLSH